MLFSLLELVVQHVLLSAPQYPTPEEKAEMDARSVYVGNVSLCDSKGGLCFYYFSLCVCVCVCVCRWTTSPLQRNWASISKRVERSIESLFSVISTQDHRKGRSRDSAAVLRIMVKWLCVCTGLRMLSLLRRRW